MISFVVSVFTAPVNVLVDVLFQDILLAPLSENNESRAGAKVTPISASKIHERVKQSRNSTLLRSVLSSKLLLSDEKQYLKIPEETAAAYGRATVLVSRALSQQVGSRSSIDAISSGDMSVEMIDRRFREMTSHLHKQRSLLNRRQQIAFDNSWRLNFYFLYVSFSWVFIG